MNDLSDALAGILARVRRRPVTRWILRASLAAFGVLTQVWISSVAGPRAWTIAGIVAVLLGVAFARTVVPLLVALLFVVEVAALDLAVPAMVPVAIGLLGWHICAALLSTGRPWSTLGAGVIVAYRLPASAALGAIALTAVASWIASGLTWAQAPAISLLALLVVVLGCIIVLWPAPRE